MAELLGTIASGISVATLAVQVGQSIWKLKDCWSQVKEAPGTIKLQLRQLEQLYRILRSIEDNRTHIQGPSMPAESLEMCKDGADELSALVDELAEKLHEKRGWGKKNASLQIILKKDEMKRLKERLNETIQILQLACCCQTNALLQRNTLLLETTRDMIQMQPNILLAEITKSLAINTRVPPSQNTEDSSRYLTGTSTHGLSSSVLGFILGSLQVQTQYRRQKGKTRQEISAKYKLPVWFSNYVWDLSAYRVFSGWQFTLRNYRITEESEFVQRIEDGDLVGVQNMLTNRTVFVDDRIEHYSYIYDYSYNVTPLHIAAQKGNLEICKLLLSEGADIFAVDDNNDTPLHILSFRGAINIVEKQVNLLDLHSLFITFGASDALIEDVSTLACFNGCKSSFSFLQQQIFPPYYDLPIDKRFEAGFALCKRGWHNAPELLKMALCPSTITREVATYVDSRGRTILHEITEGLAKTALGMTCYTSDDSRHPQLNPDPALDTTSIDGWRILAREIIMAGASVTAIDEERCTPFQKLISSFSETSGGFMVKNWPGHFHWHDALLYVITNWLVDLDLCGIDLLEPDTPYGYLNYGHLRLINFAYGPQPEDWTFWFSEPTDEFAGDFWYLIENPMDDYETDDEQGNAELPLPGAWVEDDEEDDYESSQEDTNQESDEKEDDQFVDSEPVFQEMA